MVKEADTTYMLNELQNLTPGGQDGLNRTFCTTGSNTYASMMVVKATFYEHGTVYLE